MGVVRTQTLASKRQTVEPEPIRLTSTVSKTPFDSNATVPTILRSADRRLITILAILNFLLFAIHIGVAIVISVIDVSFSITIFETRLHPSAINNITCVYDYAYDGDNKRYCSSPQYTTSGNDSIPENCVAPLLAHNASSRQDDIVGIPVGSFELTKFSDDATGVIATRWILFAISVITGVAHLGYGLTFVRFRSSAAAFDWATKVGGLPSRWYEYALTASLMSFFVANLANVFDMYALLAFVLGTFSLMFVGLSAEQLLARGDVEQALLLVYLPGMALFVMTWFAPSRQIFTEIFKLSCKSWSTDTAFTCSNLTCLGHETPITFFITIFISFFLAFPIILLSKAFAMGRFFERWFRQTLLRSRNVGPCFHKTFVAFLKPNAFFVFLFFGGPSLAFKRMLKDIFYPLVDRPWLLPSIQPVTDSVRSQVFIMGELAYSIASVTSKLFLSFYFITVFSTRRY